MLLLLATGAARANAYDCVFIEDMHFKGPGPYPHVPAKSKEHCCDLCAERDDCAAGIFAPPEKQKQKEKTEEPSYAPPPPPPP
jgi:hypothetical protein